jgi:hypothetical protein
VEKLIARLAEAVVDPDQDETEWQEHLARLCQEGDVLSIVRGHADQPMFVSCLGEPITFEAMEKQKGSLHAILVWDRADALVEGILADGKHVLRDSPAVRALLEVTHDAGIFSARSAAVIARASSVFVLPEAIDPQTLDDQERKLLANTAELLTKSVGGRLRSVRLGDFGGSVSGATEELCLNGASKEGVFQRRSSGIRGYLVEWLPAILRFRHMLINRHHPLYRAQLLASIEDPWLAAAGLASALLHVEDIEPERIHRLLLTLAHTRLEMA